MSRTSCAKFTLILSLIICIAAETDGQVTISEFLVSAVNDHEVRTFGDQDSYLQSKPYRLPALREVEGRYVNRELLQTHNQFAIRLSPANPWEMRATSRYYKDIHGSITLEREMALRDALSARYYTILEYLYYTELKSLNVRAQRTLDQQLEILEEQSGSRYFDADEYAELKVDQLGYEVSLQEYDFEVANQLHRIERLYPKAHGKTVSWDPAAIISVEQIGRLVDSLTRESARSTLLEYQRQRLKVAQSHYELEKSNINVGFGQVSYDFRRYYQNRTPINLSFGLTIPVVNPNKPDMARRRLQVIKAEYDIKEAEEEVDIDKLILQDKLASQVKRYTTLKARITELEESDFAQTLSTMKRGDPLLYVQFNERIRKLDILLLRIKRNIYVTYIDYLAFTDRLQEQPLINYLSPTLGSIE